MAILDFPNAPTVGQIATLTNGCSYQWSGTVWTLAAGASAIAGGDLTGTYPNPTLKNVGSDGGFARVYRAAAYSVPNAAMTALTFDTVVTNQGGLWAAGTPDRLTIPTTGVYLFGASVQFTSSGVGGNRRIIQLQIGAWVYAVAEGPGGMFTAANVVAAAKLNAADTVQVFVYQDTGAALALQVAWQVPNLWACRLI